MLKHLLRAALTSAAVLFGAAGLTGAAWAQEAGQATTATEGQAAAPADQTAAADQAAAPAAQPGEVQDMAQGSADAPVTIVEYGSFTCPHCANWHAEVYPKLKADYIETGKVRFVFREVYFDRPGLWASMVARCGGEMRFFPIHDMIYDQQREWIGDSQPATIADNLRRLGISAGLDAAQVDACLKDQAQAEALVAWFQANATADDVQGTPTFLINGEKHSGEMSYDEFKGYVDAALAAAGAQ